jgi:hypothetical protein
MAEKRKCIHCGQPGGVGPRELRPYGPGGADVCAECVFNGPPERLTEAQASLSKRLRHPGPLLLDPEEQAGPRPLKGHKA